MGRLLTRIIRLTLRFLWPPLYILWLRLRVSIWGSNALEHAVAFCPAWLTLRILAAYGAEIGPEVDFHGRLQLHGTYQMHGKLKIGARCHIGPNVALDLSSTITLEDCCTVSLNAIVLTHIDVGYSPLSQHAYPSVWKGVTIEDGAYIGAGAIILAGVRVGRRAVVGAGAVVTEDVPPYTVVAGVPAKVVKQLDADALGLR